MRDCWQGLICGVLWASVIAWNFRTHLAYEELFLLQVVGALVGSAVPGGQGLRFCAALAQVLRCTLIWTIYGIAMGIAVTLFGAGMCGPNLTAMVTMLLGICLWLGGFGAVSGFMVGVLAVFSRP